MDAERQARFHERTELEDKLLEGCSSNVVDFPLRGDASSPAQKAARRRLSLPPRRRVAPLSMRDWTAICIGAIALCAVLSAFFFAVGIYTTN